MSKSLGNIIDPVDMIEKFGADAVRMALVVGTGAGNDSNLSEDNVKAYKHFANKLWNITRFVLTNTEDTFREENQFSEQDKKIYNEFLSLSKEVTEYIEEYRLNLASEKLYNYVWHEFADKIVEESKAILSGGDENAKLSRKTLLASILKDSIMLLHPFMPFVTEEIWSMLPKTSKGQKLLIIEQWPTKK